MVLRSKFGRAALITAALALTTATPALADVNGAATIAGTESTALTATDAPAFGTTLDGRDQTLTDTFDMTVEDSRGTGAGWKLSISSTTFSAGGETPRSLSNTAAQITGVNFACVAAATCTNPVNETVTYPKPVPADSVAPTAVDFFSAKKDSGMGEFTVTPTMELTVPANAYEGSYTSVVTLTSAETP